MPAVTVEEEEEDDEEDDEDEEDVDDEDEEELTLGATGRSATVTGRGFGSCFNNNGGVTGGGKEGSFVELSSDTEVVEFLEDAASRLVAGEEVEGPVSGVPPIKMDIFTLIVRRRYRRCALFGPFVFDSYLFGEKLFGRCRVFKSQSPS